MDLYQGGFYRFSNYVYWLMCLNLFFLLSNILMFGSLIFLVPTISNAILYFVAFIPAGPAFAALFYSLNQITNREMTPFQIFFTAYKKNFMDSLKVWLPIVTVFFILLIDIQYFNQNPTTTNQILSGIFLVGLFLLVIFSLYALLLITHYQFRIRDSYRLSIYYLVTWIKRSTGNAGILFLTIVLMFMTTDFIILLFASLVAWLLILNTKPIIQDVAVSFVKAEKDGEFTERPISMEGDSNVKSNQII
ncbi:DUF624 domain-containing protein [Gracilibacillus caseinilyticus]|uniref:DUF624 domain-containing protein n=1 Tax=Gracilibacillus caseinilyticus TaxID=2932256 RepID=A0ABY4EWZ6_9BACI|nr:DUF624 domain-containing protein [Gracilibacillus caseinilyticus]UOQ48377.1 DUF624 domain-containing protein [Gracilibacillus caseinilyticus]